MSNYLMKKAGVVFAILLVLLAALGMVGQTIHERERYQDQVVRQVAQSTSNEQTLTGPILVIPYEVADTSSNPKTGWEEVHTQSFNYYVLPQALHVSGKADVQARKLGIYQAQVYAAEMVFQGRFGQIQLDALTQREGFLRLGKPYFVVALSDARGIMGISQFSLNGRQFDFKEGVIDSHFDKGVHVPVNMDELMAASAENRFAFTLNVQGTEKLSVVPLGRESELSLQSNWQHPNFVGSMLPHSRAINEQGFSAQWQSSWFANNMNDQFGDDLAPYLKSENLPAFSVGMVQTVSQYLLNERTVKYAILFIGLTFISFVAFELVSHLRIHPVQYLLVGAALVMFYLLLLAFSERIGFAWSYLVAAVSCSGLIGVYLCSVLKGLARGMGFTGGLLALYGLLFVILQSEDQALLLGSVLLFVVLAAVMLGTRRVDWYQLTASFDMSRVARHGPRSAAGQPYPDE
ncbi:cell envelope integrity protein CreD [Saezia sanguinis]|nr:cell envelope integrity protein CreD [Saezia sanguinis]